MAFALNVVKLCRLFLVREKKVIKNYAASVLHSDFSRILQLKCSLFRTKDNIEVFVEPRSSV